MLFLQELLVLSSGDLLLFWSGEAGDGGSGDRGNGGGGVSGIYECVATFSSGANITMATFQVELVSGKTDQWYLRPCLFSLPSSFLFIFRSSLFHIFLLFPVPSHVMMSNLLQRNPKMTSLQPTRR